MHKSKILVPYKNYPGGPGTFIKQLTDDFRDSNFTNKLHMKISTILVIVYYNPFVLVFYKFVLKKKIVLRLDGIRTPTFSLNLNYLKMLISLCISKFIYKYLADTIVFQGEYIKSNVTRLFGTTNKKNVIINNCINIPFNKEDKLLDNKISLGYWSSGINLDQFELLLAIESALFKRGLNFKIIVIGTLNFKIDSIMNERDFSRITYYPKTDQNSVYQIAKNIDIFLMLKESSYPNALVETLALGIPVVGLDGKGNREIIPEKVGVLFKNNDNFIELVDLFLRGIFRVMENYNYYLLNIDDHYNLKHRLEIMKEQYLEILS